LAEVFEVITYRYSNLYLQKIFDIEMIGQRCVTCRCDTLNMDTVDWANVQYAGLTCVCNAGVGHFMMVSSRKISYVAGPQLENI